MQNLLSNLKAILNSRIKIKKDWEEAFLRTAYKFPGKL